MVEKTKLNEKEAGVGPFNKSLILEETRSKLDSDELEQGARELTGGKVASDSSNSIGHFDYNNFNYKTPMRPVLNQSNGTSMMQPYLPLTLALPGWTL